MTSKLWMVALGISSLSLAACDIHSSTYLYDEHPRRAVVVREEPRPVYGGPVYVEPAPIIVREEPPPVPVERIVARPAPEYVWVPGHYDWDGRRWVLRAGHWERPPHPGAVWVPPRTEHRGTDIRFSVGVWR